MTIDRASRKAALAVYESLPDEERKACDLFLDGVSIKQIARQLSKSRWTVYNQLAKLRLKFAVSDNASLMCLVLNARQDKNAE